MREYHIAPCCTFPLLGDGALRLGKKRVDPLDARHGRLDGLDLHAQVFDGGENAGDVVDHRHRGAYRHAEQGQYLHFAGGGEQHDDAHHYGVQQHHRRIDRVIEVGALHGGIAVTDAPVIAALHIVLDPQRPDGTDIVQRFRHLSGHGGNGAAVVQLRRQHPLLHMAGEHCERRQHQQQDQRETGVLHGNHRYDGDDAEGIRRHADDTGGKQRLYRIHISRKPRSHLSGILLRQSTGRKLCQLL